MGTPSHAITTYPCPLCEGRGFIGEEEPDGASPDEVESGEVEGVTRYEEEPQGGGRLDGCFIATAVYGTPAEPKIDVLRTCRDNFLSRNCLGRMFIRTYYSVSPPIAYYLSNHKVQRRAVRELLIDPMVKVIRHFVPSQ